MSTSKFVDCWVVVVGGDGSGVGGDGGSIGSEGGGVDDSGLAGGTGGIRGVGEDRVVCMALVVRGEGWNGRIGVGIGSGVV